jgi:hypothetical protein
VNAYPANSLVATGSVTAPGVNGVIASIVAPPEGVYEVAVHIALTGTAETALANLSLRENATSVANLPSLSTFAQRIEIPQVEVNAGGGNLNVVAIAAATAGAIYNVTLVATRVG